MLSGADTATPEGVASLVLNLKQQGYGAEAAQLQQMQKSSVMQDKMNQLNLDAGTENLTVAKLNRTAAENAVAGLPAQRAALSSMLTTSDIPENKKKAIAVAIGAGAYDNKAEALVTALFPEGGDNYKVVGNAIFDTKEGSFIVPPSVTGGADGPDTSSIDPDEYDPESYSDFLQAWRVSNTQAERDASVQVLRPKAADGYRWSEGFNEANEPIKVQRPVEGTKEYVDTSKEVRAANASAEHVIRNSSNSVDIADKILKALETGTVQTGIAGIALSYFPETGEANVTADIETLLSNLGIGELEEMRAASANGASGFGQLTEKELSLLVTRVRNLSQVQSREQQIENLTVVRDTFADLANNAKTDWTLDEWIGIAPRPQEQPAAAQSITTPSGTTYTIKVNP